MLYYWENCARQRLLYCENWMAHIAETTFFNAIDDDFAEQKSGNYKRDIYADEAAPVFPKGTVIHVSATYDNTAANKNNPDPDQWVGSGDRTVDEMAHAWMNVVYISDQEYQEWLAQHRPANRSQN